MINIFAVKGDEIWLKKNLKEIGGMDCFYGRQVFKYLHTNQSYTVEEIVIDLPRCLVTLIEFPKIPFDLKFFEDGSHFKSIDYSLHPDYEIYKDFLERPSNYTERKIEPKQKLKIKDILMHIIGSIIRITVETLQSFINFLFYGTRDYESMEIYALPGHKVNVTKISFNSFSEEDEQDVRENLKVGEIYTVKYTRVSKNYSYVVLTEFPEIKFDTALFEDTNKQTEELSRKHLDYPLMVAFLKEYEQYKK
ncbi:MAG: hypothetical protein AAF518_25130 [Spirochaetota bacterium]